MSIEFICEHCGGTLRVEEYLAGQRIECYHCKAPAVIPQEGEKAIIDFTCLSCGEKFRVPASRAGSRTKCPECGAILEVPTAEGASPPPRYEDETGLREVPPVPADPFKGAPAPAASPRLIRHGRYGRRGAAGAMADDEGADQPLYVPTKQKVGVGTIFVVLGVGGAIVIALFLILRGQSEKEKNIPPLHAVLKYDAVHDQILIQNTMPEAWKSAVMTIETTSGTRYTYKQDSVPPRNPVAISCSQFTNDADEALDTTKTPGKTFTIMAQYAGKVHKLRAPMPSQRPVSGKTP